MKKDVYRYKRVGNLLIIQHGNIVAVYDVRTLPLSIRLQPYNDRCWEDLAVSVSNNRLPQRLDPVVSFFNDDTFQDWHDFSARMGGGGIEVESVEQEFEDMERENARMPVNCYFCGELIMADQAAAYDWTSSFHTFTHPKHVWEERGPACPACTVSYLVVDPEDGEIVWPAYGKEAC